MQERDALNEDLREVYKCDLSIVAGTVQDSAASVAALSLGQPNQASPDGDDPGFVDVDEPTDIP